MRLFNKSASFSFYNFAKRSAVAAALFSTVCALTQAQAQAPAAPPVVLGPITDLATGLASSVQTLNRVQIGSVTVNIGPLKNIYQIRAYRPLFVDANGALPIVASLRSLLTENAEKKGLKAQYYWLSEIDARLQKKDAGSLVELDLLLAQSYLTFANDLATGRTNPQDPSQNIADLELKKRSFQDFALLEKISSDGEGMRAGLASLEPTNPAYVMMLEVLARLQDVKNKGGWPEIKFTKLIKPNESDANVPAIRMRLADLGMIKDFNQRNNTSPIYDPILVQAVIALQGASKLAVDGVIGKGTLGALLGPVDDRINQVRANLERWRLLPRNLGDHYIFVDLGRQELDVYRNGQHSLWMKVVVGQELRKTPSFSDQLTSVIVNPYWHAPTSIVVKDILPKVLMDPTYFERLQMKVFSNGVEVDPYFIDWSQYSLTNPPPYTFREEPGDHNSLGRLKFDLSENRKAIYLHDTNRPDLFNMEQRLFSSGCIRVEKPLVLADYLLREQGISEFDISNMIMDPAVIAKRVRLKTPVRVYIVGTTIAVYPDGAVLFGLDIYKQDRSLIDAMNGVRVVPPPVTR